MISIHLACLGKILGKSKKDTSVMNADNYKYVSVGKVKIVENDNDSFFINGFVFSSY